MYQEDKIKKELIKKLYQLDCVNSKVGKMEICDECAGDGDRCDLCHKGADLSEEIKQLQLDTIYFPLVGLDKEIIAELDRCWGDLESIGTGTVSDVAEEKMSQPKSKEISLEEVDELRKKIFESNIEKHLNFKLAELKEGIRERISRVKPLRIAERIDPHSCHLYSEVVRCYLFSNFEASCVLCRAITESIMERFVESKGQGHLHTGKDNMSYREICLRVLHVDKGTIILSDKIRKKANNILHEKDTAKDAEALGAIELLQEFIKKFPK